MDSIKEKLIDTLNSHFNPEHIEIQNESHMHRVPLHSETHFKVIMVSNLFNNQNKVKRHQLVYALTSKWMNNPIHALSLHLFTPLEWTEFSAKNLDSPLCKSKQ